MSDEKLDKLIYKQGLQSDDNPFEFVMSTATPDRAGDIVEQDWSLKWFRKNPIALWCHKSDSPIGTWRKVRVEEGLGLVGLNHLRQTAMEFGVNEAEFSWILESNTLSWKSLKKGGAQRSKTYRMYDFGPNSEWAEG